MGFSDDEADAEDHPPDPFDVALAEYRRAEHRHASKQPTGARRQSRRAHVAVESEPIEDRIGVRKQPRVYERASRSSR